MDIMNPTLSFTRKAEKSIKHSQRRIYKKVKGRGEAFAYKNYATNRQLNSANASPVRQRIEHAKKIARNVCRSNVNVTVMICLGVETA